jgi:hypothetical protein
MFLPDFRLDSLNNLKKKVATAFLAKDGAELAAILSAELAEIPYHQNKIVEKKITGDSHLGESFFHALIYKFLSLMGFIVKSESASSRGRSDIDIILPGDNVIVLELKYIPAKAADKAALEAKALEQPAGDAKTKSSPKSDAKTANAKAVRAIEAKNASEKAERELAALMERAAVAAIEQSRNTFQDKKYLNKAKSLVLGGLVVAGRDRVLVKFESIRESS